MKEESALAQFMSITQMMILKGKMKWYVYFFVYYRWITKIDLYFLLAPNIFNHQVPL